MALWYYIANRNDADTREIRSENLYKPFDTRRVGIMYNQSFPKMTEGCPDKLESKRINTFSSIDKI